MMLSTEGVQGENNKRSSRRCTEGAVECKVWGESSATAGGLVATIDA